ncbi:MAG: aminotransferase class V-fold PLP-dependent enzyme [Phycisphaerales bacterium]|nr:aminotransferase class V-fold PLP-dependent enzyme [Phycisphaerales bacterium]
MPKTQPPVAPDCPARDEWSLDFTYAFLNHGSFGALPKRVQAFTDELRSKIESKPVQWLGRGVTELLAPSRAKASKWVGCPEACLGFVTNATSGVGAHLRSLRFAPGDSILTTNHVYNAVRKYASRVATQWGASYREISIPLPVVSGESFAQQVISAIDSTTKLVIVDHITSPTALVIPVGLIVSECKRRGIACLIDGAHAIGNVPIDASAIGADLYTTNLHKWAFAPKGCAVVAVRTDLLPSVRPETLSHYIDDGFTPAFDWQGTRDLAAWAGAVAGLEFLEDAGGIKLMEHNHSMTRWAHELLLEGLDAEPIAPLDGGLFASMASVRLPESLRESFGAPEKLAASLYGEARIEVPIIEWNGAWFVRISAQVYNRPHEYELLVRELRQRIPVGAPRPAPV